MPSLQHSPSNIALLLESYGPGGAEHVLINLAEGLRRRGYQIFPIVRQISGSEGWLHRQLRLRGFETDQFRLQRPLDWQCLHDLINICRKRDIHLLHSHEFTMGVYGAVAARLLRRPYVITMHGGRSFAKRPRRRAALNWAIRGSRASTAVSRATAAFITQTLSLPPQAITVVPNGISFRIGEGDGVRRELGISMGEPLIVAVGNLYPVKAHIVLLKALASLLVTHPTLRWKAAIAGRGSEEARLREFITSRDLSDRVMLLGSRSDIPDILAATDIWVMPSISEGMPLSLLEAMFAGRAIVASRVGGIPEVVNEGTEAILVPPGDEVGLAASIQRLLEDEGLRASLGIAAARRAERDHKTERMIDGYEELYGRLPIA